MDAKTKTCSRCGSDLRGVCVKETSDNAIYVVCVECGEKVRLSAEAPTAQTETSQEDSAAAAVAPSGSPSETRQTQSAKVRSPTGANAQKLRSQPLTTPSVAWPSSSAGQTFYWLFLSLAFLSTCVLSFQSRFSNPIEYILEDFSHSAADEDAVERLGLRFVFGCGNAIIWYIILTLIRAAYLGISGKGK